VDGSVTYSVASNSWKYLEKYWNILSNNLPMKTYIVVYGMENSEVNLINNVTAIHSVTFTRIRFSLPKIENSAICAA
jgi:hypothetical protein